LIFYRSVLRSRATGKQGEAHAEGRWGEKLGAPNVSLCHESHPRRF
jgi:hypothetical protein